MPGYTVSGTLGHEVMSEPTAITTQAGDVIPVNLSIEYISFSAHSDFRQTSEFIEELNPTHVVLVHGAEEEMRRLRRGLHQKFGEGKLEVLCPKNCQAVEMAFHAQSVANVIGTLAEVRPGASGGTITGLLLRQNFSYRLVADEELAQHTTLNTVSIVQRPSLPFHGDPDALRQELSQLFDVQDGGLGNDGLQRFDVAGAVVISVDVRQCKAQLEWQSTAANDLVGDAVASLLLRVEARAMANGGMSGLGQVQTPQITSGVVVKQEDASLASARASDSARAALAAGSLKRVREASEE